MARPSSAWCWLPQSPIGLCHCRHCTGEDAGGCSIKAGSCCLGTVPWLVSWLGEAGSTECSCHCLLRVELGECWSLRQEAGLASLPLRWVSAAFSLPLLDGVREWSDSHSQLGPDSLPLTPSLPSWPAWGLFSFFLGLEGLPVPTPPQVLGGERVDPSDKIQGRVLYLGLLRGSGAQLSSGSRP